RNPVRPLVTGREVTHASTSPTFGKWLVRAIQSLNGGMSHSVSGALSSKREQFWGRAVQASRDSLDPGRFLFVVSFQRFQQFPQRCACAHSSFLCRIVCDRRHFFTFPRRQAAIGGVENNLVLPALLARDWKHFPPFDRGSEGIDLPRVGKLVGDSFFGDALSVAPELQFNRTLDVQRIVCA